MYYKIPDFEGALSFIDDMQDESFTEMKSEKRIVRAKFKRMGMETKVEVKKDSLKKHHCEEVSLQLNEGVIPNAATIHAARKKRELARNLQSGTDINWINVRKSDASNVMSDDEISDEAVESKSVRQFGIVQDTPKQIEVLTAIDDVASGSDEEKFDKEQMHKGVHNCPLADGTANDMSNDPLFRTYSSPQPVLDATVTIIPVSVESLQSQLCCQLEHLKEQATHNSETIYKLKCDIHAAETEITEMELQSHELSMKYDFFQKMKCFVKDLLFCLTEKVWMCALWKKKT